MLLRLNSWNLSINMDTESHRIMYVSMLQDKKMAYYLYGFEYLVDVYIIGLLIVVIIGGSSMNEKELNEKLLKMEEQLKEDCLDIHDFIWKRQEEQNDHFDNFDKSQKIAFIDLYSKVQALRGCLITYNNWFVK